MQVFGDISAKLSRNPLGIIALFIALIYGLAALVLAQSGSTLDAQQRWLLLGFLVVFPFVVLWVFYKLVAQHHAKLYAPGDYKDESHFLASVTRVVGYRAVEDAAPDSDATATAALPSPEQLALPSPAPPAGTNEEISAEQKKTYINAALAELEHELGTAVDRFVTLFRRSDLTFYGAAARGDQLLLIHVGVLTTPDYPHDLITSLRHKTEEAYKEARRVKMRGQVVLLLVIVYTGAEGLAKLENAIRAKFARDRSEELRLYAAEFLLAVQKEREEQLT